MIFIIEAIHYCLSADVLEKFRNMSLEICEIDTALFHSISGLPWQVVG